MAISITLDNGVVIAINTATKKDKEYFNEAGAKLDKTPRPLGKKLYAVMPARDDENYADYVTAIKMAKAERIVPDRTTKVAKALTLLAKTLNQNTIKILEAQGTSIKEFVGEYVEALNTSVDANVANNVTEKAEVKFSF